MYSREMEERFAKAREQMVQWDLMGRGITDAGVLKVMSEIKREEFVPETYRSQAYADCPLPIGNGQTISQPYIVALMTQELQLSRNCEVLEIGTGSGYQTAILSRLARKVYTIDKFSELSESARLVLGRLGIDNVEFYVGDGTCGWPSPSEGRGGPEEKSFERIIFTASAPQVPEPLMEQLAEDGVMVGPVGYGAVQELVVWEKKRGKTAERAICDVRFVKLVGKFGFEG